MVARSFRRLLGDLPERRCRRPGRFLITLPFFEILNRFAADFLVFILGMAVTE